MSILIRGLKMPKNCEECTFGLWPFGGEISGAMEMSCFVTNHIVCPTVDGYPDDCPLIELPPHGRLIDADAAMKAACEALCHLGVFCPDNLCKEVRETFDAVPTIIESEKEDG